MKWCLDFSIPKAPFQIGYQEHLFSMGSCFSEEIAQKLLGLGWSGIQNPFGLVYNPISLAQQLDWLETETFETEEMFYHRGLWRDFRCHSRLSTPEEKQTRDAIEQAWKEGKNSLNKADVLIFTLGTAFAWEDIHSGMIVNNCHQLPEKRFRRRLLSIEEMEGALGCILEKKQEEKKRKIILTVSPVRYLRDRLMMSNRIR